MTEKFTCSNCDQEKEMAKLAKTVEVLDSQPIQTCHECYRFYHDRQQTKPEERHFFCDYCRFEVISIHFRRKVSVSTPNELGLVHGQFYRLCSSCNSKVREYNDAEDINEGRRKLEEWE